MTISAVPGENWTFVGWEVVSGNGCRIGDENSESTTVTIVEDTVIQAKFIDGYRVQIDQPYINEGNASALSFTFSGADGGGTYYYSIDDDDAGTQPVTGSGVVETGTCQVTGINVSPLRDCILILGFYIIDDAGNSGETIYDTVIKDTKPPGGSFVINNDNSNTLSEFVTLTMSITGATLMRFGNTTNEVNEAFWEPYAETKSWTLSGIGSKTIYGEFRDIAGNRYEPENVIQPFF